MVIETFKELLRMKQEDVKLTCLKYLISKKYEIQYGDGYVYGRGDIPVMLIAHMDTVHKDVPYEIYYDNEKEVMWSPQGIGGDDRCGVYAIMEILKTHKPYVLFVEDEEIGSIGAGKAVKRIEVPDVNFLIELDRRGVDDCVFYECGNEKFQQYIQNFGFKKKEGTFTDIVELSDAWQMASVNLSIGYNREHTTSETINLKLMKATIEKVKKILDDANKDDSYFDYEPCKKYSYGYNKWKDYGDWMYNETTGEWYEVKPPKQNKQLKAFEEVNKSDEKSIDDKAIEELEKKLDEKKEEIKKVGDK